MIQTIYPVRITKAARRDLKEIYDWIADHDSVAHADDVLDRLLQAVESIAKLPERGSRPRELRPGVRTDCRQVFFKPYRVIYRIRPAEVLIVLIADGRRNLQSLFMQRRLAIAVSELLYPGARMQSGVFLKKTPPFTELERAR